MKSKLKNRQWNCPMSLYELNKELKPQGHSTNHLWHVMTSILTITVCRNNNSYNSNYTNNRNELYLGCCKLGIENLKEAKNDQKWSFWAFLAFFPISFSSLQHPNYIKSQTLLNENINYMSLNMSTRNLKVETNLKQTRAFKTRCCIKKFLLVYRWTHLVSKRKSSIEWQLNNFFRLIVFYLIWINTEQWQIPQ